jgi:hypothetical protein
VAALSEFVSPSELRKAAVRFRRPARAHPESAQRNGCQQVRCNQSLRTIRVVASTSVKQARENVSKSVYGVCGTSSATPRNSVSFVFLPTALDRFRQSRVFCRFPADERRTPAVVTGLRSIETTSFGRRSAQIKRARWSLRDRRWTQGDRRV